MLIEKDIIDKPLEIKTITFVNKFATGYIGILKKQINPRIPLNIKIGDNNI